MEESVKDSLTAEIIPPSSSPAGDVFVFVEKNKTLRPCIDYHFFKSRPGILFRSCVQQTFCLLILISLMHTALLE